MNHGYKDSTVEAMQRSAAKAEAMLKMLANAKRLMILCHLLKEEKTVTQLVELINLSPSALSQHLARMRLQNLVASEKRGQKVYYRISTREVEAILATLCLIYGRE